MIANVVEDLGLKLDELDYIAFLVLLDHTKAFYTVDHKILLKKLQILLNFFNSACSLIRPYLMNRSQRVYLNGNNSNSLNIGRDIPQGSILGPLCSVYTYINCNSSVHRHTGDYVLTRSTLIYRKLVTGLMLMD